MSDPKHIREIVDRVVGEVFEARVAELRGAIAERVAEELAEGPSEPAVDRSQGPTAQLDAAVASVQDAGAQADILRALVDGAAKFGARVLLMVARGGTLTGWQARGFEDNDGARGFSLDSSQGLAGRAIHDHTPAGAAAAEFSSDFVRRFGNPADGNAVVLPLVVRDKVPAVLYADAGTEKPHCDVPALQLLVRSTALWLELIGLRKTSPAAEAEASGSMAAVASASAAPAPKAQPVAPPEPPKPAVVAPPAPEPPPAAAPVAPAPAVSVSPEDEEVHKKAKRFAKLLVDEIKLYNQAKVAEGRKSKDLYERLKDDIDKSRATYEKRYGATAAAAANYFNQEVVRILAENDASLLGSNFPHS